ncbi:UvrD-helicase domain-containing protein [Pseudomonas sp. O39]|uniref:UvrD-helicase domain-containing protein n=1 Tax=Pseudomonas sp. O39 TaxID=3379130 RepID=UPI00387B62A7
MRDQKHIASLLASVFSYVLVDEYQDTKQIQYDLHVSQQKSECTGAIFTFKPFLNIGLANRGRPCTSG